MFKAFNMHVVALAAVAALAHAAPAAAQDDDALRVRVSYADLNLASSTSAQRLLERIRVAADTACGGAPDIRAVATQRPFETCRSAAIERAVTQVGAPALLALAHHQNPASVLASR